MRILEHNTVPCIVSKIPDGLQNTYKIIGGLYFIVITFVETSIIARTLNACHQHSEPSCSDSMNADAFVVIIASLFSNDTNNLSVEFVRFPVHYLVLFAHLLSLSNNISSIHSPYRTRL